VSERLLPLPISVEDEIVLVERARVGDEEALDELCRAYTGRIEQIAQALLPRHLPDGDPGLAEDLVQEGYLALLEFWESTECRERLYRIGATEAISRRLERAVLSAYSPSSMRTYPGTKNALRFTRLLETEGYSFSQAITAMTGIDIGQVRARKALKQCYWQYFQGWPIEDCVPRSGSHVPVLVALDGFR